MSIRPGDIIVGVNRRKVRSVQEFLAVLQASQDVIMLNLLRGDFQADDRNPLKRARRSQHKRTSRISVRGIIRILW